MSLAFVFLQLRRSIEAQSASVIRAGVYLRVSSSTQQLLEVRRFGHILAAARLHL